MQALNILECSEIIYRALLKKSCIDPDTREVSIDAFFLRPDEQGISVACASKCPAEILASKFNRCRGVASLHVGRLRNIGLDVIYDYDENIPGHALIVNVPHREVDRDNAERLAGLVARQSRLIWLP